VKLARGRAKTVGVDFILNVPLAALDGPLAEALGGSDRLGTEGVDAVLGCHVTVAEEKRPIPALRQWAAQGNLILQPDPDGKFRRARPGLVAGDADTPIFAFQLCRVFAGTPDETGSALGTAWIWHDDTDGSVEVAGRFRVPAEVLIDLSGPAQFFEMLGRQFSALDVLDGKVPPETFRGKLVLIGPALRNADRFSVSVNPAGGDAEYRRFFERRYGVETDALAEEGVRVEVLRNWGMSGVEIHANLASQILQGRYLRETARELPWLGPAAIGAVVVGLGWVFWQDPASGKRRVLRSMIGSGVLLGAVLAGAVALSGALFIRHRWVFIPLELIVAFTAQAACGIGYTTAALRRQNRKIERMFGSAVGEELLAYIHAHPEVMTRPRRCEATVLFSDIRGFTALTEALGSEQVVVLLSEHFEALCRPLAREGAWVDKYVGDLVMAAWNVLAPFDDHALLPPVRLRGKTGRHTLYEVLGLVDGPAVPGKEAEADEARPAPAGQPAG